jgi:hypothetical protein
MNESEDSEELSSEDHHLGSQRHIRYEWKKNARQWLVVPAAHDPRSVPSGMPLRTRFTQLGNWRFTMIDNHYIAAEVIVIGNAQEIIRGSGKGIFFDDSPGQELRTLDTEEFD